MVPLSHPYTITGKTIALTIDRKQRILSTELKQATSVQESTHSVVLRSLCYLDTLRNGKRFEWLEGNEWKRNYFWRFKRYSWLSQCPQWEPIDSIMNPTIATQNVISDRDFDFLEWCFNTVLLCQPSFLNFWLPWVCMWQGGVVGRLVTPARIISSCSTPTDQEGRGPGRDREAAWTHCIAVYKHGSWDAHGIDSGKKTVQGDSWDLNSTFFLASNSSASPVISCLIVSNPGMPEALIFIRGSWFLVLLLIRYVFLPFPEKHTETWQIFISAPI